MPLADHAPWNVSMDKEFHDRFENYRQKFIKQHDIKISKSEFGRFIFEQWETKYLVLVNEIEATADAAIVEIDKRTAELNKMTPGTGEVRVKFKVEGSVA